MKTSTYLLSRLSIVFFVLGLSVSVLGQSVEDKNRVASMHGLGSSVRFEVGAPHASVTLTVVAPDGQVFTKEYKAGNSPEFRLNQDKGERLPDGQYTYELRVTPIFSSEVKEALAAAREKGNAAEVQRGFVKRGIIPAQSLVQSGGFAVINGSIITAGDSEEIGGRSLATSQPPASRVVAPSRTGYKVQRHHPRFMVFDQVIADDLIVQGSLCAGIDCVNNEDFGFDTIRMKENNTRLQFDDTSVTAGFPTNNWQIRANSSASGGGSFLAFVDQGATGTSETGTIVFEVDAGAPANSLRVSSIGNVGLGTGTPVLDLHVNTSNTPAMRLEQNSSGGFTAQTWDIAGNEANFFIRDVTGGSLLPLRIRPGAPTSSLDIAGSGNVGVGTASPGTRLDVSGNAATVGSDLLANTRTNNTTKVSRLAMPPFVNTNLSFAYAAAATTSTDNIAAVGGAAGGFSAATVVVFHTAGNTNTDSGTERMRITSIGRVGIGTTTPDQLLSVNGDASKVGGGSWLNFSDERLKTFRGPFKSGLDAVMQLQPLRYQFRPNNAAGLDSQSEFIGLGAQSVQKVIPEAVTTNSNGHMMINNDPIIWTMLNAIKEQQKEIVELKRQIRQLQAKQRRRK